MRNFERDSVAISLFARHGNVMMLEYMHIAKGYSEENEKC